jgi:Dyp-type peroxidase family
VSKQPKDEPPLALDQIQGNVIPGFLKNHQHFHFFSIVDAVVAKAFLARWHVNLSTSAQVLRSHAEWKAKRAKLGREPDAEKVALRNIALSAAALVKLTSKGEVEQFDDKGFKQGLAKRSGFIGDPNKNESESGHRSGWVVGGPSKPVDGVLILASDHLAHLEAEGQKLSADFAANGIKVVHVDVGNVNAAPHPGHEQFGFKDGISHPAVRGRWPAAPYDVISPRTIPADKTFDQIRADFAEPGRRLVWPGHFVFGYGRQKGNDSRTYDDANRPAGPGWANNGSLLVYRRLRQDADAFAKFVANTAKALAKKYPKTAPDKDRFAALLVGRWPSGTPIMRSPDKDIGLTGDSANYFQFADKQTPALPGDKAPNPGDPDGQICPLAAHIRKVNPRDQTTDVGVADRTPTRYLLRRGITYSTGAKDKGLIFVAYQSSIDDQFEFLMGAWVNQAEAPRAHAGHDPILSLGPDRYFNLPIGKTPEKITLKEKFVIPTGGEYMFSPSIDFFSTTLAGTAKKKGP